MKSDIDQLALILLPPSELRQPGFGAWSSGTNGYSRFLEAGIRQSKEAALRCAENGMEKECDIFLERASELEERLRKEAGRANNGSEGE